MELNDSIGDSRRSTNASQTQVKIPEFKRTANCKSLIGLAKMLHDQQSRSVSPGPSVARSAAFTRQESHSSTVISSTVKYLFRTEVHTFAFSVAANAILSFFPFVLLLLTVVRRVFHSRVMSDVITELLRDLAKNRRRDHSAVACPHARLVHHDRHDYLRIFRRCHPDK